MVSLNTDLQPRDAATPVSELNDPTANDAAATVRSDGREILFFSTRNGGLGGTDLWASTRASARDPWSAPVNLGSPVNGASQDQQATLTKDGRALLFSSNRAGSAGSVDLWMSTRMRIR